MKKFLLGTVALAALGASANAADMRARPYRGSRGPVHDLDRLSRRRRGRHRVGRDPGCTSTSQSGITFALVSCKSSQVQQIANGFDMNGFNGGFTRAAIIRRAHGFSLSR